VSALKEITVSAPQDEILSSCEDRNLALWGVGSGKSHTAGFLSADFVRNYPHVRGFIGANTYQQLAKSTLDRIFKVWNDTFRWVEGEQYVVDRIPPDNWPRFGPKLKSYENTITFNNGALVFTASLDNYKAIDGTEFGWAVLDETKDTKEEAVKEVIVARLRQVGMWKDADCNIYGARPIGECKSWNPLFIFTSPAKVDWINEWFGLGDQETVEEIHRKIFSETDYYVRCQNGQKVVIASTHHNQANLPEDYIANLIRDLGGNQNRINMLVYGSPVATTGGEYYGAFERMRHVKACELVEGVPIHAWFDFNRNPYITLVLAQVIRKEGVFTVSVFDEMCLEQPRSNTEALCLEFEGKYMLKRAKVGLFYSGDATGKSEKTSALEHDYAIIRRMLYRYLTNSSDRTLISNPHLVPSRDFVNKILSGGFVNIQLVISPRCKNLIADLEFLKEGPDGGPLKQIVKDAVKGKSYQKYGHTSDALKYGLIATFNTLYEQ
jgi:hypothetical protein